MTVHFLRQHLDAELTATRAVLDTAQHAPLGWTPHPTSFSLGRLAMHVAVIPSWTEAFTRGGSYDMGAGAPGPAVPVSGAEILATHEAAVTRAHAALDGLADPMLDEGWTLMRDGVHVETMTRAEAISRYVVRHLVHHRGQLTVYLRLCGLPVPAMYGDSADCRLLPPERPA